MKILLSGCGGHMGQAVCRLAAAQENLQIVCGVDPMASTGGSFPVYADFSQIPESQPVDVVIDFSHPSALEGILAFCTQRKVPAVLCTTGYTKEQTERVMAASADAPLFRSANMSLGVQVLAALCRQATAILGGDFDIEIVEKHHNRKLDAPSGTAIFLAEEIRSTLKEDAELVYDRHERRIARPKQEIGISSVRGGTIVGEHEVLFAGTDEMITLNHTALSRDTFAAGALRAARFMYGKDPGMYSMKDLLREAGL